MSYSVKQYMRTDLPIVDVKNSAVEASKIMVEKEIGCAIVLDKNKPVGIVTEKDLVVKVMAKDKEPSKVMVSEIMTKPVITIEPDASIEDAVKIMAENGIRRLPVVHKGIIYGLFTARELAKNFNDYADKVTRDIIKTMSIVSLPF